MLPPREIRMKVCVVGTSRAGKTALVHRLVHDDFGNAPRPETAARVSRALLPVRAPWSGETWNVSFHLWDIVGDTRDPDVIGTYLRQASALVVVADLTHPEAFEDVDLWIDGVREVAGTVPVAILGNKLDLVDFGDLDWSPLAMASARFSAPLLPTSAKRGDNVRAAFVTVAEMGLARENGIPLIDAAS